MKEEFRKALDDYADAVLEAEGGDLIGGEAKALKKARKRVEKLFDAQPTMVEIGIRYRKSNYRVAPIGIMDDPLMGEKATDYNETLEQLLAAKVRNSLTARIPGGEPSPGEAVERRVTSWKKRKTPKEPNPFTEQEIADMPSKEPRPFPSIEQEIQ